MLIFKIVIIKIWILDDLNFFRFWRIVQKKTTFMIILINLSILICFNIVSLSFKQNFHSTDSKKIAPLFLTSLSIASENSEDNNDFWWFGGRKLKILLNFTNRKNRGFSNFKYFSSTTYFINLGIGIFSNRLTYFNN